MCKSIALLDMNLHILYSYTTYEVRKLRRRRSLRGCATIAVESALLPSGETSLKFKSQIAQYCVEGSIDLAASLVYVRPLQPKMVILKCRFKTVSRDICRYARPEQHTLMMSEESGSSSSVAKPASAAR